ncbi:MAG: MoaD/ThiS family protein [Phycisphaeraceae bacterium]
MTVRVLLFASLAQQTGVSETTIMLADAAGGPSPTVADARDALLRQYPALTPLADRLAYAVNLAYVPLSQPLHDGDELALIPPVSGG